MLYIILLFTLISVSLQGVRLAETQAEFRNKIQSYKEVNEDRTADYSVWQKDGKFLFKCLHRGCRHILTSSSGIKNHVRTSHIAAQPKAAIASKNVVEYKPLAVVMDAIVIKGSDSSSTTPTTAPSNSQKSTAPSKMAISNLLN